MGAAVDCGAVVVVVIDCGAGAVVVVVAIVVADGNCGDVALSSSLATPSSSSSSLSSTSFASSSSPFRRRSYRRMLLWVFSVVRRMGVGVVMVTGIATVGVWIWMILGDTDNYIRDDYKITTTKRPTTVNLRPFVGSDSDSDSDTIRTFPRCVAMYGAPTSRNEVIELDVYALKYPGKRPSDWSKSALQRQNHLQQSRDFFRHERDVWENNDNNNNHCRAMHDWQRWTRPTCNVFHELDLADAVETSTDGRVRIVNNGFFRDVWTVSDFAVDPAVRRPVRTTTSSSSSYEWPALKPKWHALKTLRYEHRYLDRNYDRHRRDAMAMERLTASPYIVDIYGHCGNSG